MTPVALINILASGFFFMMANLAMKQLGTQPFFVLYPTVGLAMMAGAYFQVEALSAARLGSAVAIILSVEIILSFAVAAMLLGERFSRADLAGVILVVSGIVILASRPGEIETAQHVEPSGTASGIQVADNDTKL